MKVIGINGSPRRTKNTATMLEHALKGAAAQGAETELIHLFDLKFTGCKSCFHCKRLGGNYIGKCVLKDDLKEVLEKIFEADALVVASPIYYHDVTGAVRNLFERLWFPGNLYSADGSIAYTKRMKVGLIYTMGVPNVDKFQYTSMFERHKSIFEQYFGETQIITSLDAYQFDDYSKYTSSAFDPIKKKERYETEFPKDCENAVRLGEWLVEK